MKYLITGGAGFIGSHLCSKLAKEGNEVIAIDNFSDYYNVGLKNLRVENLLNPLNIKVLKIATQKINDINKLIAETKPEVVIHLAAQAGVRLPINQVNKYVESNLLGFSNVLQSIVIHKVPYFLYASSSSVYGNDATLPYTENEKNLHPSSFYGATKLANELLTPTLVKNSLTVARGLRFFTVYGPWGRPDMAYFRMIANVLSGSEFNLYGDGTIQRDFTYIEDTVDSIIALSKEMQGRIFGYSDIVNIGVGNPRSMKDLLNCIFEVSQVKVQYSYQPSNSSDTIKTFCDPTTLKSLLGFQPETSLESGIDKTFQWAKQPIISKQLKEWINLGQ